MPCGTGFQLRHRNCSSPPPAHGGQGCESKNFTEGRICVMGPCHVPGNKVFGIIVVFLVATELSKRKISISEKPFKKMIFDLLL